LANVPAMLPTVEMEKSRPAVRPCGQGRARAVARRSASPREHALGAPKAGSMRAAVGARPGSQPTTASEEGLSRNGTASTPAAPSPIAATSSSGRVPVGERAPAQ